MYVDLHLHTNHSDGKLSVSDTIGLANDRGINVLSITDHDSVGGVEEAIVAYFSFFTPKRYSHDTWKNSARATTS